MPWTALQQGSTAPASSLQGRRSRPGQPMDPIRPAAPSARRFTSPACTLTPQRVHREGRAAVRRLGRGPKGPRTLRPMAPDAGLVARQACRVTQRQGGPGKGPASKAASDLPTAGPTGKEAMAWTPHPATWRATADRCAQLPRSAGRRPLTEQARGDGDSSPIRPRPCQPIGRRSVLSITGPPRRKPTEPATQGRPERLARHANAAHPDRLGPVRGVSLTMSSRSPSCSQRPPRTTFLGRMAQAGWDLGPWDPGETRVLLRGRRTPVHPASARGVRRRRPWPASCSWRMGLASGAS